LNPVVASLLYSAAERYLNSGDPAPADRDRLLKLQAWAEASVPVVLPEEDDNAPALPPATSARSSATVSELAAILPLPTTRGGPPVKHWAVAVTTAPRRQPTLDACLRSLTKAGWQQPYVFADGAVAVPSGFQHLPRNTRRSPLGAWQNYHRSLRQLLALEPHADALMMIQDDVLFPDTPAICPYLKNVLWPASPPPLVSLYCCADYTASRPGWSPWPDTWQYGALAFIFPRALAESLIREAPEQPPVGQSGEQLQGGIDVIIGRWASRAGVPIIRPTPSLVQHVGHVSTIWSTARAVGLRRASQFVGDFL
jgi:hypothetical protein